MQQPPVQVVVAPMQPEPTVTAYQSMPRPPTVEPDLSALKCASIILGFAGIVMLWGNFIGGILAISVLCKVGCCGGTGTQIIHAVRTPSPCCCCCGCCPCTLKTRAIAVIVVCSIYMLGSYFFLEDYLDDVCGVLVTDANSNQMVAAYGAAVKALNAAKGAYALQHVNAEEPVISEGSFDGMGGVAWAIVSPSAVCSDTQPLSYPFPSDNVHYPHPFVDFSGKMVSYVMASNGVALILASVVTWLANSAEKTLRSQSLICPTERIQSYA